MKILIILFISFLFSQSYAALTDISCVEKASFTNYNQFSEKIFEAPFNELPVFYQEWMSGTLDENRDNSISEVEYEKMACRLSKTILDITNNLHYEFPVYMNGQINLYEYWANDSKITNDKEFSVAMGKEARGWLMDFFWKNKFIPQRYRIEILEAVSSGAYTVISEDLKDQIDLSGSDTSKETTYRKALQLTYIIDKLLKNPVPEALLVSYFKHASETKVFSFVKNITPYAVEAFVHSLSMSAAGPREAYHFYIMEEVSLKIVKDGYVWGRAKDNHRHLLQNPNFMVVRSKSFENRINKTLDIWVESKEFNKLLKDYYKQPIKNDEDLLSWMQSLLNQLADNFWQESLELVPYVGAFTERNAYLDGQKIYINTHSLLELNKELEGNKEVLLTHLLNISIQEWIHYLQRMKPEIYADNLSFYNDPAIAFQIFGNQGVKWYEDQPIEKDAHDIAKGFVLRSQKFFKKP